MRIACANCLCSQQDVEVSQTANSIAVEVPIGWTYEVREHHEDLGIFVEFTCFDCNTLLHGKVRN